MIDRFYISLYSASMIQADSLRSSRLWLLMSDRSFKQHVLNIHRSRVITALFDRYMAGALWNCCRLRTRSVYTIQPCTS